MLLVWGSGFNGTQQSNMCHNQYLSSILNFNGTTPSLTGTVGTHGMANSLNYRRSKGRRRIGLA
jgi:hypothetical protein